MTLIGAAQLLVIATSTGRFPNPARIPAAVDVVCQAGGYQKDQGARY
jgi:hypothetical protein